MSDIIKQNESFTNFASDSLSSFANSLEHKINNIKTINHIHNFDIEKEIILTCTLFGSVFLSSIALNNINKLLLLESSYFKKILIGVNASIMIGSGYIFFSFSKLYK